LSNKKKQVQGDIYTQVGHKLRFSLVLINDSCVVHVRNTLLRTLRALLSLIILTPRKIVTTQVKEFTTENT